MAHRPWRVARTSRACARHERLFPPDDSADETGYQFNATPSDGPFIVMASSTSLDLNL
jgi:hypothetical protein